MERVMMDVLERSWVVGVCFEDRIVQEAYKSWHQMRQQKGRDIRADVIVEVQAADLRRHPAICISTIFSAPTFPVSHFVLHCDTMFHDVA